MDKIDQEKLMFIFEIIATNFLLITGISSTFIGIYSLYEDFSYKFIEYQYKKQNEVKNKTAVNFGIGETLYQNEQLAVMDYLRSRKSRPHLKIRSIKY
jgi:hypothetical protein